MENKNRLAENLRKYQSLNHLTLAEFSEELTIPKTTLQSLLKDGNTTLDTLIRVQTALGVTLDELVYGEEWIEKKYIESQVTANVGWLVDLSEEARKEFLLYISKAADVVVDARKRRE